MIQTLMIAVSTRQNTTNAIPAAQLKPDEVLFVETSGAKKNNWSKGIIQVLKKRNFNVLKPIELEHVEDARIDLIYKKILEYLHDKEYKIIWNIGGGQKAQQIALWRVFENRIKNGYNSDFVCYANPESKQIEIWKFSDTDNLMQTVLPMNADLSAKEIFTIFGFTATYDDKQIIYKNGKNIWTENKHSYKLLEYEEFRKFFFKVPESSTKNKDNQKTFEKEDFENLIKNFDDEALKNDVNQIFKNEPVKIHKNIVLQKVKQIRKLTNIHILKVFNKKYEAQPIPVSDELRQTIKDLINEDLSELIPTYDFLQKYFSKIILGAKKSQGFLFERMLIDKLLALIPEVNNIHEIYYSVEIFNPKDKATNTAEYDILIVTKQATCITIDAKTYKIEKKDLDARIMNLREGAGRYVNFVLAFPIYNDEMPNTTKITIENAQKRKITSYTIASQTVELSIGKEKTIQVKSISNFFKDLK